MQDEANSVEPEKTAEVEKDPSNQPQPESATPSSPIGDDVAPEKQNITTTPNAPTRYGDWERKGRCIDF